MTKENLIFSMLLTGDFLSYIILHYFFNKIVYKNANFASSPVIQSYVSQTWLSVPTALGFPTRWNAL